MYRFSDLTDPEALDALSDMPWILEARSRLYGSLVKREDCLGAIGEIKKLDKPENEKRN